MQFLILNVFIIQSRYIDLFTVKFKGTDWLFNLSILICVQSCTYIGTMLAWYFWDPEFIPQDHESKKIKEEGTHNNFETI